MHSHSLFEYVRACAHILYKRTQLYYRVAAAPRPEGPLPGWLVQRVVPQATCTAKPHTHTPALEGPHKPQAHKDGVLTDQTFASGALTTHSHPARPPGPVPNVNSPELTSVLRSAEALGNVRYEARANPSQTRLVFEDLTRPGCG